MVLLGIASHMQQLHSHICLQHANTGVIRDLVLITLREHACENQNKKTFIITNFV